jgi:hypothetical protein
MWNDKLRSYDDLVEKCPGFERKAKTMPYTSAIGKRKQNKQAFTFIRSNNHLIKPYVFRSGNFLPDKNNC